MFTEWKVGLTLLTSGTIPKVWNELTFIYVLILIVTYYNNTANFVYRTFVVTHMQRHAQYVCDNYDLHLVPPWK